MKLESLQDLLNLEATGFEKYDVDQLRLILGVARYFVRSVEREINHRENPAKETSVTFL